MLDAGGGGGGGGEGWLHWVTVGAGGRGPGNGQVRAPLPTPSILRLQACGALRAGLGKPSRSPSNPKVACAAGPLLPVMGRGERLGERSSSPEITLL